MEQKRKAAANPANGYREIERRKLVIVYPNGYGLVRFKMLIEVTEADFSGPYHYFGISDDVAASTGIPRIDDLRLGTLLDVGYRPFINYHLTSPTQEDSGIVAKEVPSESDSRLRMVQFRINRPCPVGQMISYAWEWGLPRLFNVEQGACDTSSYKALRPCEHFANEIHFVHPQEGRRVEFKSEPVLHANRTSTGEQYRLEATGFSTLDYLSYRWDLGRIASLDEYIVRWCNK